MSATTTQKKKPIDPIERVIAKIDSYLKYFGYKTRYERPMKGRAFIYGVREGYPQDLRVNIQETARGTAVSFQRINRWKLLLPAFSYVLIFLLGVTFLFLPENMKTKTWDFLHFNLEQLFFGGNIRVVTLILLSLFIVMIIYFENLLQTGRLMTLKGRFGYYTKDAIWQPNDTPLIADIIRIGVNQGFLFYLLTVLYYSPLSLSNELLSRLLAVYGVSPDSLQQAIHILIILAVVPIISFYSASKTFSYLEFRTKIDKTNRLRANAMERYTQLISYGILAAALSTLIGSMFAFTFFGLSIQEEWMYLLVFFFVFVIGPTGAFAAREGQEWLVGFIVAWIFAISVYLVFNTGKIASYAWLIIFNFLFLLFPFFIYLQNKLVEHFKETSYSPMWYVSVFPVMFYYVSIKSVIQALRGKKSLKAPSYEFHEGSAEVIDESWRKVFINKDRLLAKGKDAFTLVSLYLKSTQAYLQAYKSSHDLILLPNFAELARWLRQKSKDRVMITPEHVALADAVLWDPSFDIEVVSPSDIIKAKNAFEAAIEFIRE